MRKLKDLDDLNAAVELARQAVRAAKIKPGTNYQTEINLYWPATGLYQLDAGLLGMIVGKEMRKAGLDMSRQILSCGLHQVAARAGEVEISISPLKVKAGVKSPHTKINLPKGGHP